MAKNLASKLRTGAMVGLAALAVAAPMKAKATTLDYVTTTITDDVDQDLTRDGIQIRYDWTVRNADGQNNTSDAVWEYAIQANLEERGMYGFTDNGPGNTWNYFNGSESLFSMEGVLDTPPIRSGGIRTFSAFIDKELAIGNEQVQSYGVSNNGRTQFVNVNAPIPEPMAVGLFALGGAATLALRRMKNDYR